MKKLIIKISSSIFLILMFIGMNVYMCPGNVSAASFTENSASIDVSEEVTVYADADTSISKWESSDETVAAIGLNTTKKCTVKPVKEGTAVIIGTADDGSVAEFMLTVTSKVFEVDKTDITLGITGKNEEEIVITYGGKKMYYGYTLESDNPDIAYVSKYSDYIQAKGVGNTTVKITSKYGQVLTVNVTVLTEYNDPTPMPVTPEPTTPGQNVSGSSRLNATTAKPTSGSQANNVQSTKATSTKAPVKKKKQSSGIIMAKVNCKENSNKITGRLSVGGTSVKIKVGKTAYKKITLKGRSFKLKLKNRLKKGTKIKLTVTKKKYKKLMKTYTVKGTDKSKKNPVSILKKCINKKGYTNKEGDKTIKDSHTFDDGEVADYAIVNKASSGIISYVYMDNKDNDDISAVFLDVYYPSKKAKLTITVPSMSYDDDFNIDISTIRKKNNSYTFYTGYSRQAEIINRYNNSSLNLACRFWDELLKNETGYGLYELGFTSYK